MENLNICNLAEKTKHKNYCCICNITFGRLESRVNIFKVISKIVYRDGYYAPIKIQFPVEMHEGCYRDNFNFKGKFLEKLSEKGYKILIPLL